MGEPLAAGHEARLPRDGREENFQSSSLLGDGQPPGNSATTAIFVTRHAEKSGHHARPGPWCPEDPPLLAVDRLVDLFGVPRMAAVAGKIDFGSVLESRLCSCIRPMGDTTLLDRLGFSTTSSFGCD
jgi:hypothetical protein